MPLPDAPLETRGEPVLLEWTVHLWRRQPARAWVIFAAMAISSVLGVVMFQSLLFVFLGPLLLFSATAEYLLPIHYRITERGASAAYGAARLELEWSRVRRRDMGAEAMKLSPFAVPNRLDNFRGIVLRFAPPGQPGDRESVARLVEERLAACRASHGESPVPLPAKGAAT